MWKGLYATVTTLVAFGILVGAQERKPGSPADPGRGPFLLYCASCHGSDGRGNGPAADEFWRRPNDLTQFAKANGGVFNEALLHRIVDGRTVKSHGSVDMPVWGDAFKRRLGLDDDAVRQRIDAIVQYVGAIQERAGD